MHLLLQRLRRITLASLLATTAAVTAPSSASAFDLGFNDFDLSRYARGSSFTATDQAALRTGLVNGRSAGATFWRFPVVWLEVAGDEEPPTAQDAENPAWSGYDWRKTDRLVRAVTAAGLKPLPWIAFAPRWAEGRNRPRESALFPPGSWRPIPSKLRAFTVAFARRYSGTFIDATGTALPRLSTVQAWNEPNLYTNLTPQWGTVDGKLIPVSPKQYRRMLEAISSGFKAVQPDGQVITAGTGPFGDLNPGEPRIPPARFWKAFLCLNGPISRPVARTECPPILMDGWAHHPYPIGPPTRKARNEGDVVVPDFPKLTRMFDVVAAKGRITPAAAKNIWATEMSWDSSPPDPGGVPLALQAQYMQGAFFILWKSGVQHVVWWNSRDDAKGSDWEASYQSGIFFRGSDPSKDKPKPSYTAFRFPIAAYRTSGVAEVWVKAPAPGEVTIQAQLGGTWTTVATITAGADGVGTTPLRVGPKVELRAVQGTSTSLTWTTI